MGSFVQPERNFAPSAPRRHASIVCMLSHRFLARVIELCLRTRGPCTSMSALAGTRASEHNSTGGRLDRCGRCTLLDFMDFHRRPGGEASQRPGEASYSRGDGSFPLRRTAGNTRAKIPFAKLRPAYLPTVRRIARDPREDSHRPPGSVREFASGRPTREASHVACEASHKILHLARAHAR